MTMIYFDFTYFDCSTYIYLSTISIHIYNYISESAYVFG